ncbi:MAG: 30S ribosomal protein S20 [Clostridia bacterium]
MANHKSALKRIGITAKQNLRNRMVASSVKTAMKRFDKAVESNDKTVIDVAFKDAVSTVDKAVTKGAIHRNAANRKKAQLAIKLASAQ